MSHCLANGCFVARKLAIVGPVALTSADNAFQTEDIGTQLKIKALAGAVIAVCIGAAIFVLSGRDRFEGEVDPIGYVHTGTELRNDETGEPADAADFGFFAGSIVETGNSIADAANAGYLQVDPLERNVTLMAAGIPLVAPLQITGEEVAFDLGTTGSEPVFLSYEARADTFRVRTSLTGFGRGMSFVMTFEPSEDGIDARIAAQRQLQAENAAALAAWNDGVDGVLAQLDTIEPRAETYRLTLPGDQLMIDVPMSVAYSEFADHGRIHLSDLRTQREVVSIRIQTAAERIEGRSSTRGRFLDRPDVNTRVIIDDHATFLVAKRGSGFYYEFGMDVEGLGYSVYGWANNVGQVAVLQAATRSIGDFDAAAVTPVDPEFDALGWFAGHGLDLTAWTPFRESIAVSVENDHSSKLNNGFLVSRHDLRPSEIVLKSGEAEIARLPYACTYRPATSESPAVLYDQFYASGRPPDDAPRAYELMFWEALVESGALLDESIAFDFHGSTSVDLDDPVWMMRTPTHAAGTISGTYLMISARDMGPLQFVCITSSATPYLAVAALNILDNLPLPATDHIDPRAVAMFGRFGFAKEIGDGLLQTRTVFAEPWSLMDMDGTVLSRETFDFSSEYDDLGVFHTRNDAGKYALFAFSGEQLLPYEYDGFYSASDGTIRVEKGDEYLYYSVAERRFVPAPEQQ